MGVTRLKRKDRKNTAVAKNRVIRAQQLSSKPVIKNVDVEAIKESFAASSQKSKPAAKKVEAPNEEVVEEGKAEVVVENPVIKEVTTEAAVADEMKVEEEPKEEK